MPASKWDRGTGYLEPHGAALTRSEWALKLNCAGAASSQLLSSAEPQRLRCQTGPTAPSSSAAGLARAHGTRQHSRQPGCPSPNREQPPPRGLCGLPSARLAPSLGPAGLSAVPEWPSVHTHQTEATERPCFTQSTSLRGPCESRDSEGPGGMGTSTFF